MKPLTKKQEEAYQAIKAAERRGAPASVWDFASTTVHRLREDGLIETRGGKCYIAGGTMRANPRYMFVNIVLPNGEQRAIQCSSATQCAKVIKVESKRRPPTTMFIVVAESDDGRIGPVDRWYVNRHGVLVHHPYRSTTLLSATEALPYREAITVAEPTRRIAR